MKHKEADRRFLWSWRHNEAFGPFVDDADEVWYLCAWTMWTMGHEL